MCRPETAPLSSSTDKSNENDDNDSSSSDDTSDQEEEKGTTQTPLHQPTQRDDPRNYFVFIVGVCAQWGGRSKYGDIALYEAHRDAWIPDDQIVFLKDDNASKQNCVDSLSKLLENSFEQSTLIFYYGGHGHATGFNTPGRTFRYKELIRQIEASFRGDRVILLADCCASGNLAEFVRTPLALRHSYVCLMSTQPYMEAGADWCMTICWINVLKSKGRSLSLSQVIAYMADETAISKGDCLASYCRGAETSPDNCTWIPRLQSSSSNTSSSQGLHNLTFRDPLTTLPEQSKVGMDCKVGQRVYYRHPGGSLPGVEPSVQLMPCWMQAYIRQKHNDHRNRSVSLTVDDLVDDDLTFEITVPIASLLSEYQMWTTWVVPDEFYAAQCAMARKFKYFDYSVRPSTPVSVLWDDDGKTYNATVMDWRDVDWGEYEDDDDISLRGPLGPQIVVHWDDENKFSLVPLANVKSRNNVGAKLSRFFTDASHVTSSQMNSNNNDTTQQKQQACLIKSLETCGKIVIDGQKLFGSSLLSCPYPKDDEVYDAVALDIPSTSLETLASHAPFTAVGEYCAVRYLEDDELQLIPVEYVSVKKKKNKERRRSLCCLVSKWFSR